MLIIRSFSWATREMVRSFGYSRSALKPCKKVLTFYVGWKYSSKYFSTSSSSSESSLAVTLLFEI